MAKRISKVLDQFGRPCVVEQPHLDSKYDAAQTSIENSRHWSMTDAMSSRAANSPDVRRRLRNRSRYERDNDPIYGGMIRTVVSDIWGTGARLQAQSDDDAFNTLIERRFGEWVDVVALLENLLVAGEAKICDGEPFILLETEELHDSPVPLSLRVIEAEQCQTPPLAIPKDFSRWVDGIDLDDRSRPFAYHILREHPGDTYVTGIDFAKVPAHNVIHPFRKFRAGQFRGVPECTASLPVGAQRRRWSLATLTAAELAADFAVLISSDLAPGFEDADLPAEWQTMNINRGMITTLPAGGKANQMKAEHPGTEFTPFKHELLKEIGRPIGAPYSITAMDGSEHNYSSLRYEREIYIAALKVERELYRLKVLDRIFRAWYALARMIPGFLGRAFGDTPDVAAMRFGWYFPGFTAIDPVKDAVADTERLSNCTTTLQELLAEYGQDWKVVLNQRAREANELKRLGLPLPKWLDPSAGNFGGQDLENPITDGIDDAQPPAPEDSTAKRIALAEITREAS